MNEKKRILCMRPTMFICLKRISSLVLFCFKFERKEIGFLCCYQRYPSSMSLTSLFYKTTSQIISTFHLSPVITLKDLKSVYLTLTLIDSLEIFQAYGNTADLHDDCVTLFKQLRGVVDLEVRARHPVHHYTGKE